MCARCKAGKPCSKRGKGAKGYRLMRGKNKERGRLRRDEAPASQELSVLDYVLAVEGGFDNRSDAYIRARCDVQAQRVDARKGKACGASHISSAKKCSKQAGPQRNKRYTAPPGKTKYPTLTRGQKATETRRLRQVEHEIAAEEKAKKKAKRRKTTATVAKTLLTGVALSGALTLGDYAVRRRFARR